jgi:hypothetical protein
MPHRPPTRTTTTSADFSLRLRPSPFQAQGEISPGKNALLRCTTAGFTPPRLDHESFAEFRLLALLGSAFYPVPVHRLAVSIHASSPHSVTLMQLRFTSLVVINLREDLHLQECARAGRTKKGRVRPCLFLRQPRLRARFNPCQLFGGGGLLGFFGFLGRFGGLFGAGGSSHSGGCVRTGSSSGPRGGGNGVERDGSEGGGQNGQEGLVHGGLSKG